MYHQCPYQWDLVYKQGHKVYRPTIHTVFGTAFHETVQNWLTVMYETSAVEADKIDLHEYLFNKLKYIYITELDKNNKEHFSTKEELADFLRWNSNLRLPKEEQEGLFQYQRLAFSWNRNTNLTYS
jgi:hypothetical protein